MTRFLVFLLAVSVGIGSAVAGPYKGMIASELAIQSVKSEKTPIVKKVARSKCSHCKGTGKINAGDGVVQVMRECSHCYPDSKRPGDEPSAFTESCPEPNAPADMKPTPDPISAPKPGLLMQAFGLLSELPDLPVVTEPERQPEPPKIENPQEVPKPDSNITYDHWHAVWCGPCRKTDPIITKLIAEHPDLKISEIDFDKNKQVGEAAGVTALPVIIKYENGRVVGRLTGAHSEKKIKEFFGVSSP